MTYIKPRSAREAEPAAPSVSMASSMPAAAPRDRAYLMDVLRGLLASWVVLHHAVLFSGLDTDAWPWRVLARHGQESVLVFFILSGFAITRSLQVRPQRWSSFLIARFWRIYPVYLVAIGIGVAAVWYADHSGAALFAELGRLGFPAWVAEETSPQWLDILLHLTQLHGVVPAAWLPHADTSLVAPAWSLSTEFQFYLIAPLLCLVLLRQPDGSGAMLALVMVVAAMLPGLASDAAVSPASVFRYVDLFVLGMIGAVAHRSGILGRLGYCLLAAVVIAAGLRSGRVLVTAAVVVWMLFWWMSTTEIVARLTHTRLMRLCLFVGALSFPLYIIHYPLTRLLLIAAADWLPADRPLILTVWALLAVALSYGGAAFLHHYAEVPATRHGKRIAARRDNRAPRRAAEAHVPGAPRAAAAPAGY